MNDKDKEAFEKWELDYFGQNDNCPHYMLHIKNTWQAACEYKREEYSNLMDAMTRTSQYNHKLQAENKEWREAAKSEANIVDELQAENKKLRECVEYYADLDDECIGYDIRGVTTAREVLEKVEKKDE